MSGPNKMIDGSAAASDVRCLFNRPVYEIDCALDCRDEIGAASESGSNRRTQGAARSVSGVSRKPLLSEMAYSAWRDQHVDNLVGGVQITPLDECCPRANLDQLARSSFHVVHTSHLFPHKRSSLMDIGCYQCREWYEVLHHRPLRFF